MFNIKQEPVILTDTHLIDSARHWNLDYLSENIGNGMFTVYKSSNHKFMYHNDKKGKVTKDFRPPTVSQEMTFPEFVKMLSSKKNSDSK